MKSVGNPEALAGMVVCLLAVLVATRRDVGRLGYRAAEFWHVPTYDQANPLPRYLRPEHPPPTPAVYPPNPHFLYLDRRPEREHLLPAHLAPPNMEPISRRALLTWLVAGSALIGFAVLAWTEQGPHSGGTVVGVGGFGLLLLPLKGWSQNRHLRDAS